VTVKIAMADVPDGEPTFLKLARKTGFREAMARTPARTKLDRQAKLKIALPEVDLNEVLKSVLSAIRKFGVAGWRHSLGRSMVYGGVSLTANPEHRDSLDVRFSSLGSPRNRFDDFSRAPRGAEAAAYGGLKNTYYDTYGFRIRTAASMEGALGRFLDSIPLSMVRSRVGIIPGANVDPEEIGNSNLSTWHRDEPVFENLRINVPLRTDPNFVFETEGVEAYHVPVGHAYTWDTHRPHRVYCKGRTETIRIHLVIGVAPWFQYCPTQDAWAPNEFFGRIHPFDMLAEGLLGPHLRLTTADEVDHAA
jgi:hypothetical protein